MFGSHKYHPFAWLRRPDLAKKDSDPPDYTPMAEASKESAQIMAGLGQDQLDFAKKQYEDSLPIFQQIVDAQLETQDETNRQGKDYYDYMVANQRPVEENLNADAMAAGTAAKQEEKAGQAAADIKTQMGGQFDQAIRAGLRYGYSPESMNKMAGKAGVASASTIAAGMNQARSKEEALGYAKKMDVAGLYRGLPGASQGAYGLALNAGNAAGANNQALGNQYMAGIGQGANTIGQGRNLLQSGLGDVLNAQTNMAGSSAAAGASTTGAALGAVGGIAVAI